MERLILPEPGRTLWLKVYDTLKDTFPTTEAGPGFALTGGTLLAARFGHRHSTDIDIKVVSANDLQHLSEDTPHGKALDARMHALSARRTHTYDDLITYERENGASIDLSAGRLYPDSEPRAALVDGNASYVAENKQIMAMKTLLRGHRAPVRDVIDLIVASELDPDAARLAINILSPERLVNFHMKLHRENPHFATLAQTDTVMSLDKRWHHCLDAPGKLAAQIIEALAVRHLEVSFSREGATLRAREPEGEVVYPPTRDADQLTGLRILYGTWPDQAVAAQSENREQRAMLNAALAGQTVKPKTLKRIRFDNDDEIARMRELAAPLLAQIVRARQTYPHATLAIKSYADHVRIGWSEDARPGAEPRHWLWRTTSAADAAEMVVLLGGAPRHRRALIEDDIDTGMARARERRIGSD